jgi:methylated-DNA-protein-cysteine methyltransferase-like protein
MPPTTSMFAKILAQVRAIPRGKVATYGDVAYAAGFPGAARQVVWALHSSSGLPWHRVVGSGGKILLSGEHAFEQRMRLQAEGVQFRGQRIAMDLHHHTFFSRGNKTPGKKAAAKNTAGKTSPAKRSPAKRAATKSKAQKRSRRPRR